MTRTRRLDPLLSINLTISCVKDVNCYARILLNERILLPSISESQSRYLRQGGLRNCSYFINLWSKETTKTESFTVSKHGLSASEFADYLRVDIAYRLLRFGRLLLLFFYITFLLPGILRRRTRLVAWITWRSLLLLLLPVGFFWSVGVWLDCSLFGCCLSFCWTSSLFNFSFFSIFIETWAFLLNTMPSCTLNSKLSLQA